MLRAGMIKQQAAGIYSWLPLGYRVLRELERIVHEEQQRAGHIPLLMPTLQSADLWRESGRYDDYGEEMLRIKDRHEARHALRADQRGDDHRHLPVGAVSSYKDLPLTLYHIQWKFRDEVRPRFGVMRGREFLMKDGYNFDVDREDALHAYNRHMVSYLRTYERMGLTAIPMRADSGPIGGDDTHEFLVLADTGECEVFYDEAVTDLKLGDREVDYDDRAAGRGDLRRVHRPLRPHRRDPRRGPLRGESPRTAAASRGASRSGRSSTSAPSIPSRWARPSPRPTAARCRCEMGSHGIGVSRLLGAIIEASHDDKGIIWPEGVTPVPRRASSTSGRATAPADAACEGLYKALQGQGPRPALRRPRRAGGREVRGDGPDRPALADHRRPARPRRTAWSS